MRELRHAICGLSAVGRPSCADKLADFRLGQARFLQRRAHLKFSRRLRAGPEIAHVTGVFAVGNDRKTAGRASGSNSVNNSCLQK